jgi:hypothetical protein
MGRQAQKRASRPRAPEGSHPPPRQQPYSADVTKRRYKAPGVGGASKNDPAGGACPSTSHPSFETRLRRSSGRGGGCQAMSLGKPP